MTSLIVYLLMVHWYTGCMPQASCGFLWRQSTPRFDCLLSLFHSKFIFHILLGKSHISWSLTPPPLSPMCFRYFLLNPCLKNSFFVYQSFILNPFLMLKSQNQTPNPRFHWWNPKCRVFVNATIFPVFPKFFPKFSPVFPNFSPVFPEFFPVFSRFFHQCPSPSPVCATFAAPNAAAPRGGAAQRADQWLRQAP